MLQAICIEAAFEYPHIVSFEKRKELTRSLSDTYSPTTVRKVMVERRLGPRDWIPQAENNLDLWIPRLNLTEWIIDVPSVPPPNPEVVRTLLSAHYIWTDRPKLTGIPIGPFRKIGYRIEEVHFLCCTLR